MEMAEKHALVASIHELSADLRCRPAPYQRPCAWKASAHNTRAAASRHKITICRIRYRHFTADPPSVGSPPQEHTPRANPATPLPAIATDRPEPFGNSGQARTFR